MNRRLTAYMQPRPRLVAYLVEHNAHGLSYDGLFFLPEGNLPEIAGEYVRAPWLDEPKGEKDELG